LPAEAMERATELARGAGLMVAVGSSLEVWPVAGLPGETVAGGGKLAIVNRDATPWDGDAVLVVRADAGPTLAEVAALL
jgi:NAD-dependent deacetylase